MLYHKYKPLASRVYCTGLALLLVLSEVFSSNVQDTLPGFSRIMRLGLTGCAVLLLAGKIILLTGYEARWQKVLIAVVLVYTAFSSWYGGDLWFFLAALIGLGAKDVDLKIASAASPAQSKARSRSCRSQPHAKNTPTSRAPKPL